MRPKKSRKHNVQPEPAVRSVYPTIRNCSAATGIPEKLIKKAKSAKNPSCDAFDSGGRVKLLPLLKWIFSQPAESGDEIIDLDYQQARLAKEKADAMVEKRMKQEKESELMADLEAMLNEQLVLPCRAWLTAAPSSLAGRCNPSAPEVARKILDDAFSKEFFPLLRSKLTKAAKKP